MKDMLTGPVTILQWLFVRDDQPRAGTQIHTHMCYSEFNDMIAAMDADVISIETARPEMERLDAFVT